MFYNINHAPLWRREINVWGQRMRAASLDRLVFLGLHRFGLMGQAELGLMRRLVEPGMQIVDIGANIGLYALMLARLTGQTGQVFAFEPEPNLFTILRGNCAGSDSGNITPFQKALGSRNGRAVFRRSAFNSGDNRLTIANGAREAVDVEIARLDDVLPIRAVDFIKLDVQGHELGVFEGMTQIIDASPRLRILFEFWPAGLREAGTAPEALIEFCISRGLFLYEAEESELRPMDDSARLIASLNGKRFTNLLASRYEVMENEPR